MSQVRHFGNRTRTRQTLNAIWMVSRATSHDFVWLAERGESWASYYNAIEKLSDREWHETDTNDSEFTG
jgi:hypothetical protein